MAIDSQPKKRILILGSGFGGLYTALHLEKMDLTPRGISQAEGLTAIGAGSDRAEDAEAA